jgi:hypothetical protein
VLAFIAVAGLGAFVLFGPGIIGGGTSDDGAGALTPQPTSDDGISLGGGAAAQEATPTEQEAAAPTATATTYAPTATPEATTTPTPEPTPFPEPFVNITGASYDGYHWTVDYEVYGVEPHNGTSGVPHVHFYWNNIDQTQAGVPGGGPWQLYYGPSPVYLNGLPAQPADATAICALVANADHSYILDTGMCYEVSE